MSNHFDSANANKRIVMSKRDEKKVERCRKLVL